MTHFNEFIIEYFFFPFSMLAYAFFVTFMVREFIKHWLKERKEKKDAKKSVPDEPTTKG